MCSFIVGALRPGNSSNIKQKNKKSNILCTLLGLKSGIFPNYDILLLGLRLYISNYNFIGFFYASPQLSGD